jgi:transcriptional regulator with XRE-family HTH domain
MGKTQKWLAKQLDVSQMTVSFYARGVHSPNSERLEELKRILEIDRDKGKSLDDLVE